MTKFRRIGIFLTSLLVIALAIFMMVVPKTGYQYVTAILSFMLIFYGIRRVVYYFTLARRMVGGRLILYLGLIVLDLGIFTATLSFIPLPYVMLYLLAGYAFAGAVDLMRASEAKRYQNPVWKFILGKGVANILIAIFCLVLIFVNSTTAAVYVFAAGLIYSSIIRIVSAMRKTAVVYIQ
ncbi:MAG: DUF308 domain-containing protein [Clostridia bacterium]|nr:DUF308 domain-containing protein [Clostridia bacterium]